MQDYIERDEHATSELDQLAEVMADFSNHRNCEQLTIILARRLAAVEAAQDFTANRLGEQESHEHMEVENRLTELERRLANVAGQLERLSLFAADLNTELEGLTARIITLEKVH